VRRIEREPSQLTTDVYEQIVAELVSGKLGPGDRLVLDKLAEQLDVSRTPVRDALQRLLAEGIVELSGRRGYVVRHLTKTDIANNYEARLAVECYAAERVAELGHEAISKVRDALDQARGLALNDPQSSFEANRMIHRAIVEAIDNALMLTCFDLIWGQAMSGHVYHDFFVARGYDRFIEEHEQLIEVLALGEPDKARDAMRLHITSGRDRTPAVI
jgi:DNA-binding GntR family transcriptional regulator